MLLLILLFSFGSFVHVMGMESLNVPVSQEKCMYRFDSDNNCIKKIGERNGETFRLSNTGRKTLQCDPWWWQKYFVGLSDPKRFEINLDKNCVVIAGIEKFPTHTCLPAFPNFIHLKGFLNANYCLFPTDSKKDLCGIFDRLDLFEKHLFTTQKLFLRNSIATNLDETLTNYGEYKDQCYHLTNSHLQHIINVIEPKYRNNMFLYQSLQWIFLLSTIGSFGMTYLYMCLGQLRMDSTLTLCTTACLFFYTNWLTEGINQTNHDLIHSIKNVKEAYEKKSKH